VPTKIDDSDETYERPRSLRRVSERGEQRWEEQMLDLTVGFRFSVRLKMPKFWSLLAAH
jgi:hypothetical protein